MSTYATIQARYQYKTREDFDRAISILRNGGWINENNLFLDECGEVIDSQSINPCIDEDNLSIVIPYNYYRNLVRYIVSDVPTEPSLFQGATGLAVWTSTDGMTTGGVIRDGVAEEYDLVEWGKENDNGDEVPDFDTDFDSWIQWINETENDFMQEYYKE